MRRPLVWLAALGLSLGAAATHAPASAQQPPAGRDPHTLPLGEVQPGAQPQRPPPGQMQGQPVPPRRLPPGQQQQGFGPPGGLPQGHPPIGRPPEPQHNSGGHGGGAKHECPGHGPMDSPHPPNWWQGVLTAKHDPGMFEERPDEHGHWHRKDSFVNQLLFRYENEKDECDPRNQPPPFLASVINFAILAFLLYRFGKKPLQEALAGRKRDLMREIDTATELIDKAKARLREIESKLQNLDETREQLKADYAAQGEAERKHILAEAQERRARVKRDVEFRIEQERKAARTLLVQEAVDRAVAAAEDLLRSKVNAADQDRAADDYLAGLAAAYQSSSAGDRAQGGAA